MQKKVNKGFSDSHTARLIRDNIICSFPAKYRKFDLLLI
jgi:hypothetical protein